MHVVLDRSSSVPLYRQIAEQVQTLILDGRLPSGTRLPAIRSLARQLDVSIPTMLSAYSLLKEAGLAFGEVGSGTFVSEPRKRWAAVQFLRNLREMGPIPQYEYVSMSSGIRSLATAAADPELFHADELVAEMLALARQQPWSLYYAPAEGHGELIHQGTQLLGHHGLRVQDGDVMIGSGAFPTLSMVVGALAEPGFKVLLEESAFLGAPGCFQNLRLEPILAPRDAEGTMDLDAAEALIKRHRPQFLLVAHGFGLATGHLLSEAKRAQIARWIDRYDILLLEAGNYARLPFDEEAGACISGRIFESGRAVYLEALDYSMAAALRTSFVASTGAVQSALRQYMRARDLSGSLFLQSGLARLLARGGLRTHLQRALPRYRERRDAMHVALQSSFHRSIQWTRPKGGLAIWVTLPETIDPEGLYEEALDNGVGIAPGWMFNASPAFKRNFRLAYGIASPETIHEAIRILGRILDRRLRSG